MKAGAWFRSENSGENVSRRSPERPARNLGIIALLGGVIIAPAVAAQTSKQHALLGQKAWAAFECASLASHAKKPDEVERLFKLGMDSGRAFLEALRNGKITKEAGYTATKRRLPQ